jgi:polysaccharide pyruvyl transferase WcaK-like protein
MNFEIVGVFSANKGAVLMLEAIRERLSQSFPDARFAVPMSWATEPRLSCGLWATPGCQVRSLSLTGLLERSPVSFQKTLGFIPSDRIDVILDASGFGYGDFWGLPKLRDRLTGRLARWKTNGRKAILLPQALGPFEQPGMAEQFRKALDHLDLAFIRDGASQAYVEAVAPGRPHVHLSPDFTNLLHPELPRRLEGLRGLSAVIPNEKMVAGKGDAVRARYLEFLKAAVDAIRRSGREATILLHEGQQDRAIAAALNGSLERRAPIVDEPSALVTKALISNAELVVSSRFHGLVSSLSSAVPSLACGWSHKYQELMTDYGCADLIVDIDRPESWDSRLETLLALTSDQAFRDALADRGAKERAKSEMMWSMVLKVIGDE